MWWGIELTYQIMRFACSLGWSVAASWHLVWLVFLYCWFCWCWCRDTYLSHGNTFEQQPNLFMLVIRFRWHAVQGLRT